MEKLKVGDWVVVKTKSMAVPPLYDSNAFFNAAGTVTRVEDHTNPEIQGIRVAITHRFFDIPILGSPIVGWAYYTGKEFKKTIGPPGIVGSSASSAVKEGQR